MKIDWKNIILFILVALGISYPVQQDYFNDFFLTITKGSFISESVYLMAGLSTLIAATISLSLHKSISNRITIFGDNKIKNLLILSLPVIAFSICGLNNKFGMNKSLYGIAFASANTFYAFTEEFGWRRYLQNALEGLNKNIKYIFIGVIWWIWHFRFDTQFDIFIFPLICVGGGFLLGKLTDDIKSILPAVAIHNVIILTTNSGNFDQNKIIGIGIILLGWIVIEQIWKRKKHIAKPKLH
jgi:CAAX protease family protein